MAYSLDLHVGLRRAKWKVKIRDKEQQREEPHVTIIWRGTTTWRISLRTRQFLDEPSGSTEIPAELLDHITTPRNWRLLEAAWNDMYPTNRV